ncbi:hypothetical protein AAEX28_15495 [Lentisphaerota bacterium WC36G]|nr:hypothetical protein LJT99_02250 [Lentisphaerae bacterium WC36]
MLTSGQISQRFDFSLIDYNESDLIDSNIKFDLEYDAISVGEALELAFEKYLSHYDMEDTFFDESIIKIIKNHDLLKKYISLSLKEITLAEALNIILHSTNYDYFINDIDNKKTLCIFDDSISNSLSIPYIKSYQISEQILNNLGYILKSGFFDITDYFKSKKLISNGKILYFYKEQYQNPFIIFINLNSGDIKKLKTVLFLSANGFELRL